MMKALFALALAASLSTLAAPAWAGHYTNGDPNHSASEQLNHAARGYGYAVETFDGSRGPRR